MTDVVLIRPGLTDYDEQNRVQGTLDLPLSEKGQGQMDELLEKLRNQPFDVIYSADCEPARSTAKFLCEELGIPLKIKKELHNLDHGLWEGLKIDDIRRKYPKVYKQWLEEPETICPPEGETVPDAVARIRKVLAKPIKKGIDFGVVAPEPLATLISCVVCDTKLALPSANEQCECADAVQVFTSENGAMKESDSSSSIAIPNFKPVNDLAKKENSHS